MIFGNMSRKKINPFTVNWGRTVRRCVYCGAPMTESDEEDFGTLCEKCYMKEYY